MSWLFRVGKEEKRDGGKEGKYSFRRSDGEA